MTQLSEKDIVAMNKIKIIRLILELENTENSSKSLNEQIALAHKWQMTRGGWIDANGFEYPMLSYHYEQNEALPNFTDSIDDALLMLPHNYDWLRKSFNTMTVVKLLSDREIHDKNWAIHHDGTHSNPAIALSIAILKAIIHDR